jgi:hypothetical protein
MITAAPAEGRLSLRGDALANFMGTFAGTGSPGWYRMPEAMPRINITMVEVMLKEPPSIGLLDGLTVVSFDFVVTDGITVRKHIMNDDDT